MTSISARTDYFKLSQTNAQRVLRFRQVRQTAADGGPRRPLPRPVYTPGLKGNIESPRLIPSWNVPAKFNVIETVDEFGIPQG